MSIIGYFFCSKIIFAYKIDRGRYSFLKKNIIRENEFGHFSLSVILLISYNAGKTIIYLQYTASFQPWKNVDKHISAQVIYREISSLKKS